MQAFSIAKLQRCCALPLRAVLLACLVAPAAGAGELVVNGGFESHTGTGASLFDGWTIATQPGGQGGFYTQTGPLSPTNNMAVAAPPVGSAAAMTDQQGPSSRVLYQDITLPTGSPLTLSMRLLVSNQANDFVAPASLDYNVSTPNQQARVDIMNPSAPVFDVGSGVLRNLYTTQPSEPRSDSYMPKSWDLSAFAGQTVRLRIAEADNLHGFNLGVDAVSLVTGTNSPTSYTDPSATGSGPISAKLSGSAGCAFDSSSYTAAAPPEGTPPGIVFPHGFFVFKVTGCTTGSPITMTMHYPGALPASAAYWKFGPTPGNAVPHWYVLPSTISGNSVTFTIVDGGLGDDDLLANGIITDLGGPGAEASAFVIKPVPTLSPAALLMLGLMLAFAFWRNPARRNKNV